MNKNLIILYSKNYSAQIMTQEAYEYIKNTMDNEDIQTHQLLVISPIDAACLYEYEEILTSEEISL